MKLKFTGGFLYQYLIEDKSGYNSNYYRLPFFISCDGNDYNILHIVCDEFANEYNYSLCYDIEGDEEIIFDDRYIIPSCANDEYVIDLSNYSKEYIWY